MECFRPIVARFQANYPGYFYAFRWYWLAVSIAAALDGASTIRFMMIDGADHEMHPVIRLVSQFLGPIAGPILSKLIQLFALFLVTVYLRYYARYLFVAVTLIYLWAGWYNTWGGKLYTPMFFEYLPL